MELPSWWVLPRMDRVLILPVYLREFLVLRDAELVWQACISGKQQAIAQGGYYQA